MDNSQQLKSLRFLQWNTRSLISKKDELFKMADQFDIIAIQETWLNPDFYFSFPGFYILRKESSRKNSSGLCLLIRNNIHFTPISDVYCLNGLLDTMGVEISTIQGLLHIMSLYKNLMFSINYEHWSKLFSSFKEHDYIIIAGDFNSHNTAWGCASNSANKSLENAVSDCDLCILNNGSPTRIASPNQNNNAIDLTSKSYL